MAVTLGGQTKVKCNVLGSLCIAQGQRAQNFRTGADAIEAMLVNTSSSYCVLNAVKAIYVCMEYY